MSSPFLFKWQFPKSLSTSIFILSLACAIYTCFSSSLALSKNLNQWQIVPNESQLTFIATQNNAPVSGSFNKFTGEIYFDKDQLTQSRVHIIVDMSSLTTPYDDLTTTLANADWFNVKSFPKAEFIAKKFKKLNTKTYIAIGEIQIRKVNAPMTFTFTEVKNTGNLVVITGQGSVSRTRFNVGQGEWSDTKEIKDEVQINFKVTAKKV